MDFMDTKSLGARVKQLQMVKRQSKICALHTALWDLLDRKKDWLDLSLLLFSA